MKSKLSYKILGAWFVMLWCASGLGGQIDHVIIVSMDGARPDCVLTAQSSNIQAMAKQGAFTWWAQTINPSCTLPAHCSMLTGSQPSNHMVTWNGYIPEKGFVKTTTCFELVKKMAGRTAMFVGKEKLRHIAKPDTVDEFKVVAGNAETISMAAASYFRTNRPSLMFVHYPDPDGFGHGQGWGSAAYMAAIENCDRGIGILRTGVEQAELQSNTLFIITADHGGHRKNHGSKDIRDMTIPWIAYSPGNVIPGEIQCSVSICDTAATAVYALGLTVDAQWDGKALFDIFAHERRAVK